VDPGRRRAGSASLGAAEWRHKDVELDRLDPEQHGTQRGQVDGTPEDGDSFYDVER
jgi:hypothetical protein